MLRSNLIFYRLNDGDGKSCEEDQEDFRLAFDELLSQNFRFFFQLLFYITNVTNKGD